MKARLLALTLALAACQPDSKAPLTEAAIARDWQLATVDGAAMRGSISLTEPGRAGGQAPCNRWFATREGALPEFRLNGVGATRMACPDLAAEDAFFAALAKVTAATLEGDQLVLTGQGTRIAFRPAP